MSGKFKLYKAVESFIDNECLFKINDPLTLNYHFKQSEFVSLPILSDKDNFIQCIMITPKYKSYLVDKNINNKEIKLKITDSYFDLVLYKSNNSSNIIKCLLLLVVKDFEKEEELQNLPERNLNDINNEFKLLEKLKKFIFNYIKENKKKYQNVNSSGNLLEKILLDGAVNEIRFFNYNFNYEENRGISNMIKSIPSKLEIKQKKCENETEKKINGNNENENENEKNIVDAKKNGDTEKNINKTINDVLDELNPDYENDLIAKYLDEMPEELVDIMRKYRTINFSKDMYMKYIEAKNNGRDEQSMEKKHLFNIK